jgi:hypothetical protein
MTVVPFIDPHELARHMRQLADDLTQDALRHKDEEVAIAMLRSARDLFARAQRLARRRRRKPRD